MLESTKKPETTQEVNSDIDAAKESEDAVESSSTK